MRNEELATIADSKVPEGSPARRIGAVAGGVAGFALLGLGFALGGVVWYVSFALLLYGRGIISGIGNGAQYTLAVIWLGLSWIVSIKLVSKLWGWAGTALISSLLRRNALDSFLGHFVTGVFVHDKLSPIKGWLTR
jgi:hypothetical protein